MKAYSANTSSFVDSVALWASAKFISVNVVLLLFSNYSKNFDPSLKYSYRVHISTDDQIILVEDFERDPSQTNVGLHCGPHYETVLGMNWIKHEYIHNYCFGKLQFFWTREINSSTTFFFRAQDYLGRGVRWVWRGDGSGQINTFSQDLEPESVVINEDDTLAYIILQVGKPQTTQLLLCHHSLVVHVYDKPSEKGTF